MIIESFFFLIIFFLIAEFIGRSKHIGRWWTFFLLFGILPGIIALFLSPSAKGKPTKGTKIHLFFGIFFLIVAVYSFSSRIDNYDITDFFINVGFIATGAYLISFANGKIINQSPKFYFDNKITTVKNSHNSNDFIENSYSLSNINNHFYFIIENEKQSEPLSYEKLKEKRINENTFVWRNGLETWLPAKELEELHSIIVFSPPPFTFEKSEKQEVQTPPPFNL